MAYDHINSKGVTYYLNGKVVTLKNGYKQQIYYFTKDVRSTELTQLPTGFEVSESSRTGMPVLKRETKPSGV